MSRRPRKKKKNRNSAGRISFLCIGIFLVLVLSVQMVRLYQKNEALVQTEQTKQNELSEQEDKQKELEEQEQYIQSDEYKEKVAKDKLGLVYDNETIFREKENIKMIEKRYAGLPLTNNAGKSFYNSLCK